MARQAITVGFPSPNYVAATGVRSAILPGAYVVELVGKDQTVLAASPMRNLHADEIISTVVKLPLRIPAARE